jgi:hypothetical protein
MYDKYEIATTNKPTIIAISLIVSLSHTPLQLQIEILHRLKNNIFHTRFTDSLP